MMTQFKSSRFQRGHVLVLSFTTHLLSKLNVAHCTNCSIVAIVFAQAAVGGWAALICTLTPTAIEAGPIQKKKTVNCIVPAGLMTGSLRGLQGA